MSEKKKQKVAFSLILAVTAVVLVCGVYVFSKSVVRVLERGMEDVLEDSAERGSLLVEEQILSDLELMHSLAGFISQSDTENILDEKNIELLRRQQTNLEATRFLLIDTKGNGKSSDGLEGSVAGNDVFLKAMQTDEVVSGVVPSALLPNKEVVVLSVQVQKDNRLWGILSCVYDINTYEKTMNRKIFGEDNYSYVIDGDGKGVIWPLGSYNLIGFNSDNGFSDEAFMALCPDLKKLEGAMRSRESGVLTLTGLEGKDYYMTYCPMEINDWYYLDVVSTKAVHSKSLAATWVIWIVSIMTVVILLAMLTAILLSHRKHDRVMEAAAASDRLTGLSNWQNFKEIFEKLPDHGYAYVFFYLNDFLHISNTFGYTVGGNILKEIANVLTGFVDADEYAARLSESYFALFIHNEDQVQFKNRMNNLFTMLGKVSVVDEAINYDYQCTYRGGVCAVGPEEKAEGFEALNSKADTVVEGLAGSRKTSWGYFDDAAKKELQLRHNLSKDVYRALQEQQFIPYFQPLYDLNTKTICGAEVLVRWNHPEKGILYPKTFLKTLEASGCILELDRIMLDAACRSLQRWMEEGILPVPLSINISGLNIYRRDFVSSVCAIPKKYSVPATLITLELPENIVFADVEKTLSLAGELDKQGFRLSMDDFGSGPTSLGLLQKTRLDILKMRVDFLASSMEDHQSRTIVSQIIKLAAGLGVKVVGVGVETIEDETNMKQLGCMIGQGYYYAKPMPAQEFEKLLLEESKKGM